MKRACNMVVVVFAAYLLVSGSAPLRARAQSQPSRLFPETGHTVSGSFLKYWQEHGGLAQQGYPLSEPFVEKSDLDGKTYTVQYFERAVFEMHPENQSPYDVLLSQLGTFQYKAKYGGAGAPGQQPDAQGGQMFKETGFSVGGAFLSYWNKNGGLAQQGYPISNEFTETSPLDGKAYTVQYFERAVFEMHPENQTPYDVLLSQLGTFQLKQKYPSGAPGGTGGDTGTATPQPSTPATPSTPTRVAPEATPTGQPAPSPTRVAGTNCAPVDDSKKSKVASTGPVAIANVQFSGTEYVKIVNNGQAAANIGGWVLKDKNDQAQRYAFPGGTQIQAGGAIQVYTEPGHDYSFNSKSSIWNNCGDAAELLDSNGTVVATYAYGTHLLK